MLTSRTPAFRLPGTSLKSRDCPTQASFTIILFLYGSTTKMAGRASVFLEQDQIEELREVFESLDLDGNGTIALDELGHALDICGIKLPQYRIRELHTQFLQSDKNQDDKLDMDEFRELYVKLKKEGDIGHLFKKSVQARTDVQTHGGFADGITHSVKDTERYAFAAWINSNLDDDEDCKELLPINPDSNDLFTKVKDGILLCKLINHSVPDTIDERTINKKKPLNVYLRTENHNLGLASASSIGCNVVNIGHSDLESGTPHLVLGLLWQIIRIGLLSEINLKENPALVLLLEEGETIDDLLKLSPEQILIRWVNYQLRNAGQHRQIENFSSDIKDSEVYTYLLNQIAPAEKGVTLRPLDLPAGEERADSMLDEAEKLGCRDFITSKDVVKGNAKLNLAFVANLFNNFPALEEPADLDLNYVEESREEKTYRNWMNSLGVSPQVNRLYVDMQDGIVIFKLYDIIKPGCVDWKRVIMKFNKMRAYFEKLENGNYAVELGKEQKFSLKSTQGKDLVDGNQTLTLGLVWQLMRAYTLSILTKLSEDGTPVEDKFIIGWANDRLKEGNKTRRFTGFSDKSLSDGITILQLIDCIAPKKINWDIVKETGSEEDNKSNAKYAISMGRKIGARIYALPEDIYEVKNKLVMTIFACLLMVDWNKAKQRDL